MELRQLRHFVAVVDSGNLSRAAERVAISQPALTRSIKNLEDMLGMELLERKPRGVTPTEAGLALYRHAQIVLNACQRLAREVRELERGVTGTVHLGVAAMFATHLTSQVAESLCEAHPRLSLIINEAFFEDLLRQLSDGRLDVVFTNFPQVSVSPNLVLEPLTTVRSSIMAGRNHPLASRRELSRADLVPHRWVIADQPHAQDSFEKFFSAEGLPPPRDVFRTNSLNLMLSLVSSGRFLSPLPEHLINDKLTDRLRCLPVENQVIERQAGLIYRVGEHERPALGHVLNAFRTLAKVSGLQTLGATTDS
jgi:DNA-binding transcriptional LysR family regulator